MGQSALSLGNNSSQTFDTGFSVKTRAGVDSDSDAKKAMNGKDRSVFTRADKGSPIDKSNKKYSQEKRNKARARLSSKVRKRINNKLEIVMGPDVTTPLGEPPMFLEDDNFSVYPLKYYTKWRKIANDHYYLSKGHRTLFDTYVRNIIDQQELRQQIKDICLPSKKLRPQPISAAKLQALNNLEKSHGYEIDRCNKLFQKVHEYHNYSVAPSSGDSPENNDGISPAIEQKNPIARMKQIVLENNGGKAQPGMEFLSGLD